jgi:hypothetical protein
MNLMSVSFLRMSDGRIMIGYLRKNAQDDCRYGVRISGDEAVSWGPEILVTKPKAYYVVNNDRIVQLSSGRIVVPASDHGDYREGKPGSGRLFYSDDMGGTWQRAPGAVRLPGIGVQEPGVVELEDGSLFMIVRNSLGTIHAARSRTGGLIWGEPFSTGLVSPVAPASIKRIPCTGDLLMIFNNHRRNRVPLTAALSRNGGKTWRVVRDLETRGRSFAYTSITFVRDEIVLTYWTLLERKKETDVPIKYTLNLKLRIFPFSWLYD